MSKTTARKGVGEVLTGCREASADKVLLLQHKHRNRR